MAEYTAEISLEQYHALPTSRRAKYGNRKTEVDGRMFDSAKEAARYLELRLLERGGTISGLRCQPRYVLQEAFRHEGKTIRAIEIVPDFDYCEDGRTIVEDVKSPATRTPVFEIKRKLFLKRFVDHVFRIVE